MLKTARLILFLLLPLAASAQTITLGPIEKTSYCVGDTLYVHYTASGAFSSSNIFRYNLSDAGGSFASFINLGQSSGLEDSIAVVLPSQGNAFRIRIISSSPYAISDTSTKIVVSSYPTPESANVGAVGANGFVGDSIPFTDHSSELPGSTYYWTFDQDAQPKTSTQQNPKVVYATEGVKTGTLTVTNPSNCSKTLKTRIRVLSCNPVIPQNVHIVTGTETGQDTTVWVLSGATYTTESEDHVQTVFAEPGASIIADFRSLGQYYLKEGVSFTSKDDQGAACIVAPPGTNIPSDPWNPNQVLYCANLSFNYSKVAAVTNNDEPSTELKISQRGSHLLTSNGDGRLTIDIFNILGNKMLTAVGEHSLDLDLMSLPYGVYFAEVESGGQRVMKRIVR